MSLYDEAAVALIAEGAAGKDGVLYNIKPEEKVKPTELIAEGGFENNNVDSNWSVSVGATGTVTISNNEAVFSGVSGDNSVIFQNDILEVGKTYKVSLTIDIREGTVKIGTAGTGESNGISDGAIDTQGKHNYSFYYTVPDVGDTPERFTIARASGPYDFTVDNVSVKEVEQKALDFTFTRGSNLTATRVAPSGYIEKGRENLLKYSNEFDNSDWEGHAVGSTLIDTITGGQSGYDGSSNAFLLNKDSSDLFKRREQIITETAGVATFSVYAKAGTASSITLRGGSDDTQNVQNGNDDAADFNLANGTSSTINNSVTSSMEAITGKAGDTDRWYRCSVVFKDPTQLVQIYVNFNSASTGTVFVQNAQLENGLVATDYIETHSTTGKAGILEDSPRFDYTDVTCPHLLMEPTRVNYFAHSEYLAGTFGTINSTFTANADKSPEGVNNATSVLESTANAAHGLQKIDIDIEDGVFYSYSFFVKAKGRTKFLVQHSEATTMNTSVIVDLSGTPSVTEGRAAATGSQNIVDYGDGWYRVEINGKEGLADDADSNLNIFFHNGSGTSYAGDTTKGFLFYGFQIEKKHFCTSYIPNHGTSAGVTRLYDTTDSLDFGEYMDGDDVTLFVDLAKNPELIRDGGAGEIRLSSSNKTAGSIKLYRSGNTNLRTVVYFADVELDNNPTSHIISDGTSPNIAIRRVKSTGEFTVFYDGAQQYQAFNTNYDVLDNILIRGDDQPIFINSILLFDRALTDDECKSLAT
jgi:hypothetical protein